VGETSNEQRIPDLKKLPYFLAQREKDPRDETTNNNELNPPEPSGTILGLFEAYPLVLR
jgi:hypothetical protein